MTVFWQTKIGALKLQSKVVYIIHQYWGFGVTTVNIGMDNNILYVFIWQFVYFDGISFLFENSGLLYIIWCSVWLKFMYLCNTVMLYLLWHWTPYI